MQFFFVLCVIGIAFANGESCTLRSGDEGTCKPILECDLLRRMFNKTMRTPQDEHFLRTSRCGYEGTTPKVCCPNSDKLSCLTPEDTEGECVNIRSCPPLLDLLKTPNTTSIEYVKNSVCASPSEYSVCCGPKPDLSEPVPEQCHRTISALLPDPDGECCGLDSTIGNKIIGGNVTSINQYPWLVLIEYVSPKERNKLLCGGSLVSGKYVVTAAHCVKGSILSRGTPKFIRLGEYNITNTGPDCVKPDVGDPDCTEDVILAPIEEIIPHPKYSTFNPDKTFDIALIRMKIYAPFTDFVRPICLPKIDYILSPPTNFTFYVAGWGRYLQDIAKKKYKSSDVKLHVEVPYVVRDQCQAAIRTLPGVEDITFRSGQICAGGIEGKDSCMGDSGGPLMYENAEFRKYELIGVVGGGAEHCGQQGIPGVYAYIYEFIPWIKETIRR